MSPIESVLAYKQYIEENDEIEVTEDDLDRLRNLRKRFVSMREGINKDILGSGDVRDSLSNLVEHLKK